VGTGIKVELERLLAKVKDNLLSIAVKADRRELLLALRVAVGHSKELAILREEDLCVQQEVFSRSAWNRQRPSEGTTRRTSPVS
jgi:hypothetical protein